MIWTTIQVAKSIGLGWLLEINTRIVRDSEGDVMTEANKNPDNLGGDSRVTSGPHQPLEVLKIDFSTLKPRKTRLRRNFLMQNRGQLATCQRPPMT